VFALDSFLHRRHLWAALTATAFAGLANLAIGLLATCDRPIAPGFIAREVFAPST